MRKKKKLYWDLHGYLLVAVALVEKNGSVSTFCGMEKKWIQCVIHKHLDIGDRTKWNLSILFRDPTQFTHGYTEPVSYGTKCILTYLRTSALLEKPRVTQLLKNFPAFYGI
jgi:hypothetical protein